MDAVVFVVIGLFDDVIAALLFVVVGAALLDP